MPFKDVEHSFSDDVQDPIAGPAPAGPPAIGMLPVGLGAPAVLAPAPPPPFLVSLHLERTVESNAVQPGYGLAAITLNPIDAATGNAPAAFVFGARSQSYNPVAPPANVATEHFMLCPGDGNPVRIRWAVRDAAAGFTATLDLFRCARPKHPLWSRQFNNAGGINLANTAHWVPVGGVANNTTYYECQFNGNVRAEGPGVIIARLGEFQEGWLDSENGPYKFLLTISGPGNANHRIAWTYFHVPAHKFKLVRYVPSTELGCFGIELNPCERDVKVITKNYFGYEAPSPPTRPTPFPLNYNRHDPLKERIFRDWSAQFMFQIGAERYRPVVFVIAQGQGPVNVVLQNPSDYAPYIAHVTRLAEADFPVVLTNSTGGSGVFPSAGGHWLRLYDKSAFDESYNQPVRNVQVYEKDIATLTAAVKRAMTIAPPSIGFSSEDYSCSVMIGMPEGSYDPDAATADWLRQLAAAANSVVGQLSGTIEVLLTGLAENGSPAQTKGTRNSVSRVKAILSRTLTTVPAYRGPAPADAAAARARQAGFRMGVDDYEQDTGERRKVRIDFGRRPTPDVPQAPAFPYIACVHEYGHVFGYPDEYMDYSYRANGCRSIFRSQSRIDRLAAHFGVSSAAWPKGNTSNMNANLMSMGTVFQQRYYLTFAEAIAKLMQLGAVNAPTFAGQATRDHQMAGFPVVEDPAFTPLAAVLRGAANAFEAGGPGLLTRVDLQARVQHDLAAAPATHNLLYLNVIDSDAVVPALATGHDQRHHYVQAAVVADGECLHCAIQVEAPRAFLKLDDNATHSAVLNVVRFPAVGAPRVKANLSALRAFTGIGRLQVNPGGICAIYDAPDGGGAVNPGPGGTTLASGSGVGNLGHVNGKNVWIEGVSQGVTELTLELLDGVGAVIARTEPVEIICGPPVDVLVDGKPIGANLVIPLAGSVNSRFNRTSIKLKKQSPGVNAPTLVRIDKAPGVAGDFALFDHAGGPHVLPYDVPDADYDDKEEVTLQLEGTARSGALGDKNLTFAVGGAVFATMAVTVVDVVDLAITIGDTAPLTARSVGVQHGVPSHTDANADPISNAGGNRVFKPHLATHGFCDSALSAPAGGVAQRHADYGSDDFAVNCPLILIENSLAGGQHVSIRATVHPQALPATWIVERDKRDNQRLEQLGSPLPGLVNAPPVTTGGGDLELTAQLTPNSVGSFHVRLAATNNRDKLLVVNLVLVRAVGCNLDDSNARLPRQLPVVSKAMEGDFGAADNQHLKVTAGNWTGQVGIPTEENFACLLRGTVHCIGGGPDGRLGQDAVFAGWIQNIATFHVSGTYLDSAHPNETKDVMMHVTSNQLQGTEKSNHDRYFLNGGAALAPLDVGAAVGTEAMLDTGRTPAGGSSVLLSRSVMNAPANDDILGWRIKASAGDSPGTEFFLRHPAHPTAFLTTITYQHTFHSFLAAWTDNTTPQLTEVNQGRAFNGAGSRVFAVTGDLQWRVNGSWNVEITQGAWSGADNEEVAIPTRQVRFHRQQDMVVSIARPFAPIQTQSAAGLAEVKMPTMVWAFGWEANW